MPASKAAMSLALAAKDQTAGIIKDIDKSPFHTRFLALNALVEAVRDRGAAGSGFAPVAAEVRNLAVPAALVVRAEQKNRTVRFLDPLAQQLAATSEKNASASPELNQKVKELGRVGREPLKMVGNGEGRASVRIIPRQARNLPGGCVNGGVIERTLPKKHLFATLRSGRFLGGFRRAKGAREAPRKNPV